MPAHQDTTITHKAVILRDTKNEYRYDPSLAFFKSRVKPWRNSPSLDKSSVAQLASASDCYLCSNQEVESSSLSGGAFFLLVGVC
jgi:hypothetical protein